MNALSAPISAAPTTNAVTDARLPPAVRNGAPGAKQAYATAQSFEEMLLGQLSQSLMQSAGLAGEGEGEAGASSDGAGGMLASLLPQTLTEGVMHAGGLGLAAQLMNTLDPSAREAGAGSGGTQAAAAPLPVSAGGTKTAAAPLPVSAGGTKAAAAPLPVSDDSPAVASTGGVSA